MSKAARHISRVDPTMRAVIKRCGPCEMRHEPDAWIALASSIIGQQLSVHAARTIRNRFAALAPRGSFPRPKHVLEFSTEEMRSCGLSGAKVLSLRDLADHFERRKISTSQLKKLDDEEIIKVLLPVRGIGRWTAEMFLIFSLQRPDVLAVGDLGLRNAIKVLCNLPERPDAETMTEIAEPWRPYRSVASWYLWRSLDNEPVE